MTAGAALLARWWSRPTAQERDCWDGLWPLADEAAAALELEPGALAELRAAVAAASGEALLDEHERLLVGPGRPPCAPYESLWRADLPARERGSLMGSAATAVEQVYRDLGLRMRAGSGELPDHLVIEWEALAYALEHGVTDAADELIGAHLSRWMGPFCDAVVAHAELPFYASLARLTRGFTAALAR